MKQQPSTGSVSHGTKMKDDKFESYEKPTRQKGKGSKKKFREKGERIVKSEPYKRERLPTHQQFLWDDLMDDDL